MNRNFIRDFFRRRRIERHVRAHGPVFSYHGLEVRVPPEIGRYALNSLIRGKYEPDEAAMILKYLPSDLPVIELGGSLGVVSRLIRSRIGPDRRHLVVEANADLLDTCRANATADASPGATELIHKAVHYDAPSVRFHVGVDVHSGAVGGGDGSGSVREVGAERFDAIVARLPAGTPYSLVSDIEGAEYDIFERDREALASAQVAIVEIHPQIYAARGGSEAQFLELAEAAGFGLAERQADVVVLTRS